MILSKISLILTTIVAILVDFTSSMVEMQWNLGVILHRDCDRYVLGYASAIMTIDRYMYHIYQCMVHSIRRGCTEYMKRIRELENHGGKNFAFDDLIEHLYNHYLIYILICTYLYVFIIVLAFL